MKKLLTFGFVMDNGAYTYTTNIASGQFRMIVNALDDGTINTKVVDTFSSDEYVLHRTSEACGSFVGMVRSDYENVLHEISDKCFEPDIFKSDYARTVIQYINGTYNDELEFLWKRFPNNAIFRRKDSLKWYGAMLILSKRKLGLNSDEVVDILDLRIRSEDIEHIIDREKYFSGYHMNKKHWITICLDDSVPMDEIFQRIDTSYNLSV
ncbi:MAG: MmcQ/YjbR family DNA-binding protein [Dehalococcoidia bacterium]|nr:MmcQ/YjbR family DNA-binding protein [Dehalococcoidia bacterium]